MVVNQQEIPEAFLSLGLYGDEQTGLLRRFGVILNNSQVSFLVGRELEFIRQMGGESARSVSEKVLIDAAQWCANATFSGIMASPEWAQMIEPTIKSVQDRMDGLVAITNCLGWGKISSYKLDEAKQELEFTVDYSYYVDYWLKRYGKSNYPICYMWTGVAGGYMDLLLGSKVNEFTGEEVSCGAQTGGNQCVFRAKRLKKKFGLS